MPKVKNPLFSQEARGGIGGLVYNTWRGINTVKTNTSPTGQGTPARLAAQSLMSEVSKQWQTLSDVQRASWNQWAIDHPMPDWTGSPKRITGMNAYMMLNVQLARLSSPLIDVPPVGPAPDAPSDLTLAEATADITLDWSAPVTGGFFIEYRLYGPASAGLRARLEQTRYGGALDVAVTPAAIVVEDAEDGRYTCFARTVNEATGQTSTWVSTILDFSGT